MIFIILNYCPLLLLLKRKAMKNGFLALLLSFPILLMGWGQTGHRVVGEIAFRHMNPVAQKKVLEVLGGETPAMASNWMDFIKSNHRYDHMKQWHYVTIPDTAEYHECDHPAGGDAYVTILRIIDEIESGNFQNWTEEEALKCLIHLVGDLHQPLHVGNGTDRGGNDVKVKWFGESSNLHRVWDSEIIDGQQLSYTEYTSWIDVATQDQIARWQLDNILVWMDESKAMRSSVYETGNVERMGYEYNYHHIAELNQRLLQAGIRLAGILNELYS